MSTPEQTSIRDAWTRIAAAYDQFVTPTHLGLGREALRRAGVTRGMSFLDVACGTGALSMPAARLGAKVTAVDLSPAMIERVIARARDEGYYHLRCRVMDGCALELEDNAFDVAGSQYGVMLFPDLPTGLREMARVTRPGGKVLLVGFGSPEQLEFLRFMTAAIKSVTPHFTALPVDPPPLPFQVSDPDIMARQLASAGLGDIRVEQVTERMVFESGQALWDWLMNSNPIPGRLISDLSEEQRAAVRRVLDRMLRKRAGGCGPAVLTTPVNIGLGTR